MDLAEEKPEAKALGGHESYVTGVAIANKKAVSDGERIISLGGANDGFDWLLDLKTKSVLAQEKAPAHLYDARLGDTTEALFVGGYNRLAAYEIKA